MVPFRISVVSYRVVDFTERFHCKISLPAARASNRTKGDAVGGPERGQLPDALTPCCYNMDGGNRTMLFN